MTTNRKKVGLVLGGGAARGLAHIGVLEVLEREGIPIDAIAGTSIGAMVGGLYAYTKDVALIHTLAQEVGKQRLRMLSDFALRRQSGLLRWAWIENKLKGIIGGVQFADLQLPFSCVAADIDTGEEVILDDGSVWDAVRASSTIPGLLRVTEIGGRRLVDGGVLNPVPVSLLDKSGVDFIIAVNVLPRRTPVVDKSLTIFTVLVKTLYLQSNQLMKTSLAGADVVINPETDPIGFVDFQKVNEGIKLGAEATEQAIPEIKRKLGMG